MRGAATSASQELNERVAAEIMARIAQDRDFWEEVYEPYSQNLISRDVVRLVIDKGRVAAGGGLPQVARYLKAVNDDVSGDEEERKRFFRFKNFLYKTVKI
jgi:hypothetical protein